MADEKDFRRTIIVAAIAKTLYHAHPTLLVDFEANLQSLLEDQENYDVLDERSKILHKELLESVEALLESVNNLFGQ